MEESLRDHGILGTENDLQWFAPCSWPGNVCRCRGAECSFGHQHASLGHPVKIGRIGGLYTFAMLTWCLPCHGTKTSMDSTRLWGYWSSRRRRAGAPWENVPHDMRILTRQTGTLQIRSTSVQSLCIIFQTLKIDFGPSVFFLPSFFYLSSTSKFFPKLLSTWKLLQDFCAARRQHEGTGSLIECLLSRRRPLKLWFSWKKRSFRSSIYDTGDASEIRRLPPGDVSPNCL